MSESKEITITSLHTIVQREVLNDTLQEVSPDLFDEIAVFVGKLKKQEFDNVENKIKNVLVDMATELVTLLVKVRLEKSHTGDFTNMLDEEKYVLDSQEERHERAEMILAAILGGKSQLLDSISKSHKTRRMTVRFLKDVDEFVGADLDKYGPFKTEDLATIPHDNAQALISQELATKIRLEN